MMRVEFCDAVKLKIPVKRGDNAPVQEQEENMSFKDFLKACLGQHEAFKKGPEMARTYNSIRDKVDSITDEQRQVEFENEHMKLIQTAAKNSKWLTPDINADLIPFYDVLDSAYDPATKKNEKEKEEGKKK